MLVVEKLSFLFISDLLRVAEFGVEDVLIQVIQPVSLLSQVDRDHMRILQVDKERLRVLTGANPKTY